MSLLAHVQLTDLVSQPLAPVGGPAAGRLSGSGNWGYTSRDPEDPRDLGGFTDFYIHDSYSAGDRLFASAINILVSDVQAGLFVLRSTQR